LAQYMWGQHESLKAVAVSDMVGSLGYLLPDVDRAVLTDEFGEDLASSFHEGLRNGIDGWLDDDIAFIRPWGFDLDEIREPVTLWQGSADLMVPFAHGEWLASRLPGASIHLEQDEGHLSIGVGALDRMLDELVDIAR
jgi:pimeloyl-ACP methyl ester carboxylesterase